MKHSFLLIALMLSCVTLWADQIEVTFYTPNIVRITKTPDGKDAAQTIATKNAENLAVCLTPQQVEVKHIGNTYQSSALKVTVNPKNGVVTFATSTGKKLLTEKQTTWKERLEGKDKGAYIAGTTFQLDKEEAIYGLGIVQEEKMSKRGTSRMMQNNNTEDFIPYIQSVKGWGLYWDNYSPTLFEDNAEGMTFKSDVASLIDYYFMVGGSADGNIALMRQLTGEVPMMPLWSFGFWQSKERYKSFKELNEVVDRYRAQQIPLDCIVQDWQYWGSNYTWNAMDFLTGDFANAHHEIENLHKKEVKLLISIWSSFGPHTQQYKELAEKGLLYDFHTWPQSGLSDFWPPRMDYPSGVKPYDPFSSEARDIYWKYLKRLFDYDVDAWWMDSTEPDHLDYQDSDLEQHTAMGTFRKMHNAYPLAAVGGVYDRQRALLADRGPKADEKRVTIMTRSVFAGQQRTGANTWSGDVGSSWENLRKQLPAGLNFSLCGNPNFNSDCGGFFAGSYNQHHMPGYENPQYHELYLRWLQFGLFNPIFRSHGADVPREIYRYGKPGDPIYDAMVATVRFRYRLIPYLYSTAWQVTSNHQSYMRALVCDFAADKQVWNIGTEFMFGKEVLVAPIVNAQYTEEKIVRVDAMSGWDKQKEDTKQILTPDWTETKSHEVYLPKGTMWYDFWTGAQYKGGQTLTLTTMLQTMPMYLRAGSILPLANEAQTTQQQSWEELELRVYPGADGTFALYEDYGDGYGYERGEYSTIEIKWSEKTRQLTIGTRQGEYPGMLQTRTFKVVLPNGNFQIVKYSGNEVIVKL